MKNNKFIVPSGLREKYINSSISHEIYFIDAINDLISCINSKTSYDLIRFSALLRMLLLGKENGLETISKKYSFEIQLLANQEEILGKPLTDHETINIKKLFSDAHLHNKNTTFLQLRHEPLKVYSLEEFVEKVCLKIEGDQEYNFSIKNIIKIIANKHGAAHLEATFDSSTIDSFFWGNFSPFSMKEGNFFLEKIQEIIPILIVGVIPLCNKIIKNLENYDKENIQAESSSFANVILSKKSEN